MTNNTQIDISFIFALSSFIGLIINIILTIKRDNKANQKEDNSIKEGIIKANMKLDQVCTTNNSILLEMDKLSDKVNEIAIKQERHEIRIKMLEEKK